MICSYEKVNYGGYAEEVMANPAEALLIEVHGVIQIVDPAQKHARYEVNDEQPEFFSVYARLFDRSSTCIADFPNLTEADAYADEIGRFYKLPVELYSLARAA